MDELDLVTNEKVVDAVLGQSTVASPLDLSQYQTLQPVQPIQQQSAQQLENPVVTPSPGANVQPEAPVTKAPVTEASATTTGSEQVLEPDPLPVDIKGYKGERKVYPDEDPRKVKAPQAPQAPSHVALPSQSGSTTTVTTRGPDTSRNRLAIEKNKALAIKAEMVDQQEKYDLRKKLAFAIENDQVLKKALIAEEDSWRLYMDSEADQYDAIKLMLEMRKKQREKYAEAAKQVDPNKFWNDRTTGQMIGGALAIFAGGIGAALLGEKTNSALEIIDNAIRRDIAAQEFNIESARKEADRIGASMHDELSARELLMKNVYERYKMASDFVIQKMKSLAKKVTGPQKAALLRAIAEIGVKANEADLQAVKISANQSKTTVQKAWEVSMKDTRQDQRERRKEIDALVKAYDSDSRIKLAKDSVYQADQMLELLKSGTPLSDLYVAIKQSKLVDPTSAVLGTELDTQRNVGATYKKLSNLWSQITTGGMTDSHREMLRTSFSDYKNALYKATQEVNAWYRKKAKRRGIKYEEFEWVERPKKDFSRRGVKKVNRGVKFPTPAENKNRRQRVKVVKNKVINKDNNNKDNKKKVKVLKKDNKGKVKVLKKDNDNKKGGN